MKIVCYKGMENVVEKVVNYTLLDTKSLCFATNVVKTLEPKYCNDVCHDPKFQIGSMPRTNRWRLYM